MNVLIEQRKILEDALESLNELENDADSYNVQSFNANLYMAVLGALRKVDDAIIRGNRDEAEDR